MIRTIHVRRFIVEQDDDRCLIRIFGKEGRVELRLNPDITLGLLHRLERFRYQHLRDYRPPNKRLVPALDENGDRHFVWLNANDPIVRRLKKEGRI